MLQTTLPTNEAVELVLEYLALASDVETACQRRYNRKVTEKAEERANRDWFRRPVSYWEDRLLTNPDNPFFTFHVSIEVGLVDALEWRQHMQTLLNSVRALEAAGVPDVTLEADTTRIMGKIRVASQLRALD